MSPHPIRTWGTRGQTVSVGEWTDRGVPYYVVRWVRDGRRKTQRFPRTPAGKREAVAFAQGVYDRLRQPTPAGPPALTVAALWAAFTADRFPAMRPNSVRLYRDAWARWSAFVGPHTAAAAADHDTMAGFCRALEALPAPGTGRRRSAGLSVTTIRMILGVVRGVYRYAERTKKLPPSGVLLFEFRPAKDAIPAPPPEYDAAEYHAILRRLSPVGPGWRAWLALLVAGEQGQRAWSVVHLRWQDIDWADGVIRWPATYQKQGRELVQPLRQATRMALAWVWRHAGCPTRGWVLPAADHATRRPVYAVGSLWRALKTAERQAGVPRRASRGVHGLRRLLAGEVNRVTGNPKLALDAIGDRDEGQLQRYVQPRRVAVAAAFAALDAEGRGFGSPPETVSEPSATEGDR